MFVDKETGQVTSLVQRSIEMNVSIPVSPNAEQLDFCGLAVLVQTPQPGQYFRPAPNVLVDGEWRTSWAAMPDAEAQAIKLGENNDAYSAAVRSLTANYPQLEKDTWPTQDAESSAWLADPVSAETPWINRAAQVRGIDREEYLRRTLVKARQFVIMSAWLTGRRQNYEQAIKDGGAPVLDYQLPADVLLELNDVQQTVMTAPTSELRSLLSDAP